MLSLLQKVLPSRLSSASAGPPSSLQRPHVNVLHLSSTSRIKPEGVGIVVRELRPFRVDVNLDLLNPDESSDVLVSHLPAGELQDWLRSDVAELTRIFHQDFGYDEVHARLEVVQGVLCSRWHADNVRLRCLVTYCGPGTLYLDNRDVTRRWDSQNGGSSVERVREEHVLQAQPGDWLFLKGHLWEGNDGLGAVHKSPEGAELEPRLLLTLDDVMRPACPCCPAA